MAIYHSFLYVYQRVTINSCGLNNSHHQPALSTENLMDHDHGSSFGIKLRTSRPAHHLQDIGDGEVNLDHPAPVGKPPKVKATQKPPRNGHKWLVVQ